MLLKFQTEERYISLMRAEMEQKLNTESTMEVGTVGEQDKTCPGKENTPTKEHHDQLGKNNSTKVIQDEISSTQAGKEDVGDQDLEQTPKHQEGIAEICIPKLLPLCGDEEKVDHVTNNSQVAENLREQGIVPDDHPVEGEHPTQDQIRNQKDCPISGGNAGANPKEKSVGVEDLEVLEQLPPKKPEDICLPNPNPPLQDDFIEGEEMSPPGSLSSQDDAWVTPRPPPDDEGGSTKQNIEMGLVFKSKEMSCGEKEEEVISQPMNLSSNDENLKLKKMDTEKQNFTIKKYERQLKRENELYITYHKLFKAHCKQSVRFANFRSESYQERQALVNEITILKGKVKELDSLKKEHSKLLKAHRKQCVRYMRNKVKCDEELQSVKKDVADLQREVSAKKAAQNTPMAQSDGLDGKESELPPVEE